LLATCGAARAAAFPNTPTLIESGYPGVEITGWTGLLAPAGTSPEIAAKLQAEVARILAMRDIRERMSSQGAEPVGSTPAQFAAFIKSEAVKWSGVIRAVGLENTQ
jgi:tripartite-type tricarboxylate transporter receptor subunit TctC